MTYTSRLKKALEAAGLFGTAHEVLERGRILRRLMRPAPSIPLHREEDIVPFFIVGSGRCGTTLLRRLLVAGNEVHIPPENWHLGSTVLRFRQLRWSLEWPEIARLTAARFDYQGKTVKDTVNRWFGDTLTSVIEESVDLPENEQSLARLIDLLYRRHGREQEASFVRWGDKTPLNVGWMRVISEVFPKARFVHMLRDGTDVVNSWINVGKYSSVEKPALRWKAAVKSARGFMEKYPLRCLEIRYENLVKDTEKTLKKICDFLCLKFTAEMLNASVLQQGMNQISKLSAHENVFKPVSSSYIGKGHRNMSLRKKRQIAKIIGVALNKYGYSTPK